MWEVFADVWNIRGPAFRPSMDMPEFAPAIPAFRPIHGHQKTGIAQCAIPVFPCSTDCTADQGVDRANLSRNVRPAGG
jgi:hypothetical protein